MALFRKTRALKALITELDAEMYQHPRLTVTPARVEELVALGAKLDSIVPPDADSPLTMAVRNGNLPVVRTMLKLGAAPTGNMLQSDYPLTVAVMNGYVDIVRVLLAAGASPDGKGGKETPPLHWAVISQKARDANMAELLLAHGADRQLRDHRGETALDGLEMRFARGGVGPLTSADERAKEARDLQRFRALLS